MIKYVQHGNEWADCDSKKSRSPKKWLPLDRVHFKLDFEFTAERWEPPADHCEALWPPVSSHQHGSPLSVVPGKSGEIHIPWLCPRPTEQETREHGPISVFSQVHLSPRQSMPTNVWWLLQHHQRVLYSVFYFLAPAIVRCAPNVKAANLWGWNQQEWSLPGTLLSCSEITNSEKRPVDVARWRQRHAQSGQRAGRQLRKQPSKLKSRRVSLKTGRLCRGREGRMRNKRKYRLVSAHPPDPDTELLNPLALPGWQEHHLF